MTVESNLVAYRAADGVDEELHHIGLIYRVEIAPGENSVPGPKSAPDGDDSDGAAWFPIKNLVSSTLTPFAYSAVRVIETVEAVGCVAHSGYICPQTRRALPQY